MRWVLFLESEAIEADAAFMTVHLLLKMQRVETAFYGLVFISGSGYLIANDLVFAVLDRDLKRRT